MRSLPGSSYKLSYESIAAESHLKVSISSQTAEKKYETRSNSLELSAESENTVCMVSSEREFVSIDFYVEEQAHYKEVALKSQVYEVHNELIGVGDKLKEIARMQEFEEQKEAVHSQLLLAHENKIHWFGIAKFVLIVLVIIGQLVVLRRFGKVDCGNIFPKDSLLRF